MKNICRTILVCFCLSLFISSAFASEVWTKYEGDTRKFLVLDDEEGVKIKIYSQKKGDYHDLIKEHSFSNFQEAREFIDVQYPEFNSDKKLSRWAVSTVESKKVRKNIWRAHFAWNDEWENKYARWLQEEISTDYFAKYKIATDCADALIALRWIFARNNSLPVANTLEATGELFGHFSMRKQWENLPRGEVWYEDKLFLTALNYLMEMTSTRTVMKNDGFYVAINQKGLRAGSYIVSQNNGAGHIRIITENYFDEPGKMPINTQSSTSPREVRGLYRETFIDQAWPIRGEREIMAFRWTILKGDSWVLMDKLSDKRYSEEQFDTKDQYYSFIQFVLSRVKPSFNPFGLVQTGADDLINLTKLRLQIVREGFKYCQSNNCAEGSPGYNAWSTPSRDLKFLTKFQEMEDLIKAFDPANPGLHANWLNSLATTILSIEGSTLSLAHIKALLENKLMSFDPRDSIERRWGLTI